MIFDGSGSGIALDLSDLRCTRFSEVAVSGSRGAALLSFSGHSLGANQSPASPLMPLRSRQHAFHAAGNWHRRVPSCFSVARGAKPASHGSAAWHFRDLLISSGPRVSKIYWKGEGSGCLEGCFQFGPHGPSLSLQRLLASLATLHAEMVLANPIADSEAGVL